LKYIYDTAGRRTQMVDQSGFTDNYVYDAVGHLSELTESSGNLIDKYTYDPAGNLVREDKGNSTYTTYKYDAAGELLDLVNYAPDGSVNSRFDYTHDVLGRVATVATGGITTTYGYDPVGRLVSITDTTGLSIQYSYDAAGNRISEDDNGTLTHYTINNVNEYTSITNGIGTTNSAYDLDGNMTSRTSPGGTTT